MIVDSGHVVVHNGYMMDDSGYIVVHSGYKMDDSGQWTYSGLQWIYNG